MISVDEFKHLTSKFVELSKHLEDDWQLVETDDSQYMTKRVTSCLPQKSQPADDDDGVLVLEPAEDISSFDDALASPEGLGSRTRVPASGLVGDPSGSQGLGLEEAAVADQKDDSCMPTNIVTSQPLTYEYHVVYSESYAVPVLYFNVFTPDGSLLPLQKVWQLCPSCYQDTLQENKWTTLTQQEHPILGRPFLTLHPCRTAEVMAKVRQGAEGKGNYLITWLSTFATMAGLHLSPLYAKQETQE